MTNQEAKVERALNPNTAGLSRDAVQCLWGCSPGTHLPWIPTDECRSSRLTKSVLFLWRCQMWNYVNRVTRRPFLPSDLYQKGLFLETALPLERRQAPHSCYFGTFLCIWVVFWNVCQRVKRRTILDLSSWKSEFWILLIYHGQEGAWS